MINRIQIRNIKLFADLAVDVGEHVVIAGRNNSGKTSLLQAIAAWCEVAALWSKSNPDLARDENGEYGYTNVHLDRFHSIPLANFSQLWRNNDTSQSAAIVLHSDRWTLGFEARFEQDDLILARPLKDAEENDLESFIDDPFVATYIPPVSGVEVRESKYDPHVLRIRLARVQGGSILRNMLSTVSKEPENWNRLQEYVNAYFGYELLAPSGIDPIHVNYRHSGQDVGYDLVSAASGLLQILFVFSAMLAYRAAVFLIDKPDAHLHMELQKKIYADIRKLARDLQSQSIIATHSEQLINAAEADSLRLLTSRGLVPLRNQQLVDSLRISNSDIARTRDACGILYVEGSSDISILQEWARVLSHWLSDKFHLLFCRETAQWSMNPQKHFSIIRQEVTDAKGVILRDRDNRKADSAGTRSQPRKGLLQTQWERYEIESYLIHPDAILRFLDANGSSSAEVGRARKRLKDILPPVLYADPFKSHHSIETKAKPLLDDVLQSAGISAESSDFSRIAAQMKADEIHPEVREKLDAIAGHFSID